MPSRWFALVFGSAALLALGLVVGSLLSTPRAADAAPKAEAKPSAPFRAGHVVLSELMKDYTRWQERAKEMTDKRNAAAKELAALRDVVTASGRQGDAGGADAAEARRKFEEAERKARETIDRESTEALRELYAEIADAIRQVADERHLDAVYGMPAHPERAMEQSKQNPTQAIELLLRPPAMQPLYLRDSADLTAEVVKRLNAKADGGKR